MNRFVLFRRDEIQFSFRHNKSGIITIYVYLHRKYT